ncbi:MAG: zinc-dependent peptidase, partial [Bacteroidia bacterium]|nr:zinc-dependent peptidase [Bacteroidia bacterium]
MLSESRKQFTDKISFIGSLVILFIVATISYSLSRSILLSLVVGGLTGFLAYRFSIRKYEKRKQILQTPFPETWRKILQENVEFYQFLNDEQKSRFEQEVQVFLAEKRITGIKTEIDDLTRILVAASAIIPVFRFPEWEYEDLGEILVYPTNFNWDYQIADQHSVSGMVGQGGVLDKVMILSKPSLIAGFRSHNDNQNVGIHEFAHLVDKADGQIDGLPTAYLKPEL